ncbi:MAG TPA: hypothetical protein VIK72_19185 [Clostridiaceae bacterium]
MRFKDIQDVIKGKLKLKGNENSEMALIKSAINQAYVVFAEKDCSIGEQNYLIPLTNTLELPADFLTYHSLYVTATEIIPIVYAEDGITIISPTEVSNETIIKIPRHYIELKANGIMIRDDVLLGCNVTNIKLVYGIKPIELKLDTDIPTISAIYHQGLMYYALFLITDNQLYYDLYMSVYNSIPRDSYVSDYSDVIDVL